MKAINQTKNVVLLSEGDFAVFSEQECLNFYLRQICWNLRSMMRQADMLETAMHELSPLDAATKPPAGGDEDWLRCVHIANQCEQ